MKQLHSTITTTLLTVGLLFSMTLPVVAAPYVAPGFSVQTLTSLGTNNGALAYAPDGTLYVVHGSFTSPSNRIDVVNPNGTLGTPLVVQNATFGGIGGAVWDPVGSRLLVSNGDGGSFLYSVPVTGAPSGGQIPVNAATILADTTSSSVPFIAQVAVRPSTGDIYVSDAPFGAAQIKQIDRGTGAAHTVTNVNYDFTSGIGFDSSGKLIYQAGFFNFAGGPPTADVARATLSGAGNTTSASGTQVLHTTVGSFDLAVTSGDHVLITGNVPVSTEPGVPYTFGLFQPGLGTNASDSIVTFGTANAFDFGSSVSYLPGSTDFTAFSGAAGGRVAFILSDFSGAGTGTPNSNVVMIVTAVPEPATWVLLLVAMAGLPIARRFSLSRRERMG